MIPSEIHKKSYGKCFLLIPDSQIPQLVYAYMLKIVIAYLLLCVIFSAGYMHFLHVNDTWTELQLSVQNNQAKLHLNQSITVNNRKKVNFLVSVSDMRDRSGARASALVADLPPKGGRLAPNGTNPELFQIRLPSDIQNILTCDLKKSRICPIWGESDPPLGPNMTPLY